MLDNKKANQMIVITGASKGLGTAIAERLLDSGKSVVGLARDTSGLSFRGIDCDVSDSAAVKAAAREIKRSGEPLEALINAAGVASMNMTVTTNAETVQNLINVNLAGTIYCCQYFAPLMIRQRSGVIVNFSTIAVALGLKGEAIYAASKAGVEGFSRAFAREMADFGVRVNCIAPGPIRTDLLRGVSDAQIDKIVEQQIIRARFEKSDVCDLVDVLLSSKARSLSGQVLHVGGV